jgi:glucose-1-phosphate thymidylyltransferase
MEHLLGAFEIAGVDRIVVVTRAQKPDIPEYLGRSKKLSSLPTCVLLESSPSVPHSIAAAASFLEHRDVLLGFPDIVFHPRSAVRRLLARWHETQCDILLGLFPTDRPERSDMVELGALDRVRRILVKPRRCELRHAWIIAVWNERFTRYLTGRVDGPATDPVELHLGEVFQDALTDGLSAEGLVIEDGRFLDVGTRADGRALAAFARRHSL